MGVILKFEKSLKKWKIYEWEDTVGVFLWSVRWGGTWGGTNFEKSLSANYLLLKRLNANLAQPMITRD